MIPAGDSGVMAVSSAHETQPYGSGFAITLRDGHSTAAELTQATVAAVGPGSQVLTDGWSGYATLQAKGYRHAVVRESAVVGANLLP